MSDYVKATDWRKFSIKPFFPNVPFLYPHVEKGCIENEWVKFKSCWIGGQIYVSLRRICKRETWLFKYCEEILKTETKPSIEMSNYNYQSEKPKKLKKNKTSM